MDKEKIKPEKKQQIIEYWSCINDRHRHRSELIAEKCIAHQTRHKRVTNVWTIDAYKKVIKLRDQEGKKFKDIGNIYGISTAQAAAVYYRACSVFIRRAAARSRGEQDNGTRK